MPSCEICGAEKVGTKRVKMGRATVDSCSRCIESMNLAVEDFQKPQIKPKNTKFSGGYGGGGVAGKDLMTRGEKELASDFATRISRARNQMGLDKRELGQKLAEKVNVIQAAESGKIPTDSVIRKLERFLNIELMIPISPEETRMVGQSKSRGLTLGDFFDSDEA